jgi:hypothetical protein
MNIATTRPSFVNQGLFSKNQKIKYERPILQRVELGIVPKNEDRYMAPEAPRTEGEVFVPTSKENPVQLSGFANSRVFGNVPVRTPEGHLKTETVEETVKVPGKVLDFATGLIGGGEIGLGVGAGVGIATSVVGLGAVLLASPFLEFDPMMVMSGMGLTVLGCGAAGAVYGAVRGVHSMFKEENSLKWVEKRVTEPKLVGFRQSSKLVDGRYPEQFKADVEQTEVGRFWVPKVTT